MTVIVIAIAHAPDRETTGAPAPEPAPETAHTARESAPALVLVIALGSHTAPATVPEIARGIGPGGSIALVHDHESYHESDREIGIEIGIIGRGREKGRDQGIGIGIGGLEREIGRENEGRVHPLAGRNSRWGMVRLRKLLMLLLTVRLAL